MLFVSRLGCKVTAAHASGRELLRLQTRTPNNQENQLHHTRYTAGTHSLLCLSDEGLPERDGARDDLLDRRNRARKKHAQSMFFSRCKEGQKQPV